MAKKEYLSPLMMVNTLCSEDVLTESIEYTDSDGSYKVGGFDIGWL
jgi:hypothetical protein